MGAAQFRVVRWMVGIGWQDALLGPERTSTTPGPVAAGGAPWWGVSGVGLLSWVAVLDVASNYRRVVVGGVVVSGGAARFLRTV